jgi:ankyrin
VFRHWGIRVVIPPGAVTQPTRINCKYQPLSALAYQPPFMEREALASRVLEISPALQSFRSPVLLEIPHFASSAAGEREIVVLRSNDGENWSEHISDTVDDTQIYQVTMMRTTKHMFQKAVVAQR